MQWLILLFLGLIFSAADSAAEERKDRSLFNPAFPCAYEHYVGKRIIADHENAGEGRVREAELPPVRRIIQPGQMVTMDVNAARVNLHIDDKRVIRGVSCG